jgi:hypothetical protein
VIARLAFLALLLVGVASPAVAEVMDKEPTIGEVWRMAAVLGLGGAVAWWRTRWVGIVVFLVALLFAWDVHAELSDPYVGQSILREAGPEYVRQSYVAIVLCLACHLLAVTYKLWQWTRRSRRMKGAE